jgi:hypothetical protein
MNCPPPSPPADEIDWYADPKGWCNWKFFARDEQIAPTGDWATWLYLAGRGSRPSPSNATLSGAPVLQQ